MDEARALAALRNILARPEFAPRRQGGGFWEAFWDLLWDLVAALWDWLTSPVRSAVEGKLGWLDLALAALAVVVLAAGVVFLARTVRGHLMREASAESYAVARRRERSDRLWTEADALARAGQLDQAVRALYLAALYALEERHVLPVRDAWTNREHAERLARARPGAGAAFASVVQRYDRMRYGGGTVDEGAFGELRALVERARALALAPEGQPAGVAAAGGAAGAAA
jgi:hypothetical protein